MEIKQYLGFCLRLSYPDLLKLSEEKPDYWYAVGPRSRTTVLVKVDPRPAIAKGFSRLIRNPHFVKSPGASVVREGSFSTKRGIVGYERVIKLVNALGEIETWGWYVDGKYQDSRIVHIRITTADCDWYSGTIWDSFLQSIEVVGNPISQSSVVKKKRLASAKTVVATGVFTTLPPRLAYLLKPALAANEVPDDELEDNPELVESVRIALRQELAGLSKPAAVARVASDRDHLQQWLRDNPEDRFPETMGMYFVLGVLQYPEHLIQHLE